MPLLHSLDRFRSLSSRERRALLQALLALPLIHLLLRVFGFKRTFAFLRRASYMDQGAVSVDSLPAPRLARVARIAARRGLVRGNCLSQSLMLWWLLRRAGIASELRIGVRKEQQQMLAHAWVELDGVPLNERRDVYRQYAAFDKPIVLDSMHWA